MKEWLDHITPILAALGVPFVAIIGWLAGRKRTKVDAEKTDMQISRGLRDDLWAEIAKLREHVEQRERDCERRLSILEEQIRKRDLESAARLRTIEAQGRTIAKLKAEVARLTQGVK